MILWVDSFDHYGTVNSNMTDGAWAEVSGAISGTQARTGAKSFKLQQNSVIRRVFGGAKTTVGVAAAFFFEGLPTADQTVSPMIFCSSGNIPQLTIGLETTGILAAWRGGPGTGNRYTTKLGDTGTPAVTANAWNHIEVKANIDNSGSVEVRVNGVTVMNLTGVDTDAGAGEASQVRFETTGAGTLTPMYVDDCFAWDTTGSYNNDFVGDKKVITDFPDADTADVDWTRSTGSSNFGVIDENPPNGDTDYLETLTNGDRAGVTFPDLPAEVIEVQALVLVHKSRKTDAGDANIQLHLGSNGSESDGTDRPMTTAYTLYHDVFEVDPDTSAPFTRAAAQIASWTAERTL